MRKLIRHYDVQPEAAAVAEDEAAYLSTRVTMMALPAGLVSRVLKMIGKRVG